LAKALWNFLEVKRLEKILFAMSRMPHSIEKNRKQGKRAEDPEWRLALHYGTKLPSMRSDLDLFGKQKLLWIWTIDS
jgi:hypothetical protein